VLGRCGEGRGLHSRQCVARGVARRALETTQIVRALSGGNKTTLRTKASTRSGMPVCREVWSGQSGSASTEHTRSRIHWLSLTIHSGRAVFACGASAAHLAQPDGKWRCPVRNNGPILEEYRPTFPVPLSLSGRLRSSRHSPGTTEFQALRVWTVEPRGYSRRLRLDFFDFSHPRKSWPRALTRLPSPKGPSAHDSRPE